MDTKCQSMYPDKAMIVKLRPAGSTGADELLPSMGCDGYGHKVLLSARHCLEKYDINLMIGGPVIGLYSEDESIKMLQSFNETKLGP